MQFNAAELQKQSCFKSCFKAAFEAASNSSAARRMLRLKAACKTAQRMCVRTYMQMQPSTAQLIICCVWKQHAFTAQRMCERTFTK
jgi:hypothetical protein